MYQRIHVPYDGSASAKHVLQEVVQLTNEQHAELRIIHALDTMPWQISCSIAPVDIGPIEDAWEQAGKEILTEAVEQAKTAGIEPPSQLLKAISEAPAKIIIEEARQWKADLIVMGTHGRHGVERMFLGSVAEGVVRASTDPVLLIHGQ